MQLSNWTQLISDINLSVKRWSNSKLASREDIQDSWFHSIMKYIDLHHVNAAMNRRTADIADQ